MYKQFAKTARKYLQSMRISVQNSEKIAEVLFYITEDFFENHGNSHSTIYDMCVKRKSVFESANFKMYFIKNIQKVIEKHIKRSKDTLINKSIYRAFFSIKDVYMQKKAMLQNKSRSSDLDLILAALDVSNDEEISSMYITIRALKDKLDSKTYIRLRKCAREKFKSCRVEARYFLYVLKQVEKFEENIENRKEIEEEQNVKEQKNEKKIDKSIEIHTSESDYRKYKKGEKLDDETKLKLYIYRRKYQEELSSLRLTRLSKDDALFFIINTEQLVENKSLTLYQVLNIIEYADSNPKIKNPRGWLIERFSISRGRFYFLLKKSKSENENHVEKEKHQRKEHRDFQNQKQKQDNSVYIKEDLLYFAKKYSVPPPIISKYVDSLRLRGDVSIAVEQYLISYIWKNHITADERVKLIDYAKKELKKFVTPPPQNEAVNYIKSIIRNKIREEYLTLSTEDKIRLFSRKQHSNLHQQYCDTS